MTTPVLRIEHFDIETPMNFEYAVHRNEPRRPEKPRASRDLAINKSCTFDQSDKTFGKEVCITAIGGDLGILWPAGIVQVLKAEESVWLFDYWGPTRIKCVTLNRDDLRPKARGR